PQAQCNRLRSCFRRNPYGGRRDCHGGKGFLRVGRTLDCRKPSKACSLRSQRGIQHQIPAERRQNAGFCYQLRSEGVKLKRKIGSSSCTICEPSNFSIAFGFGSKEQLRIES